VFSFYDVRQRELLKVKAPNPNPPSPNETRNDDDDFDLKGEPTWILTHHPEIQAL
jgi:hypothetical protein